MEEHGKQTQIISENKVRGQCTGQFSVRSHLLYKLSPRFRCIWRSRHDDFTGKVTRTVVYSGCGWLQVHPSSMSSTSIYGGRTESGHSCRCEDYTELMELSIGNGQRYQPLLDVIKPLNVYPAGMGIQKGEIQEKLVMASKTQHQMFISVTCSEINFQVNLLKFDLNSKPDFSKLTSSTTNNIITMKPIFL